MSSTPPASSSGEDRVNEAIAAYMQAIERGTKPDREKFLAEYADIAKELTSFFDNQAEFEKVAERLPPRTTAPHSAEPVSRSDEPTRPFREHDVPSSKEILHYFGDYELVEEIARGGMGIVFKARQVKLNRIVAVKMILAGSFAGPEEKERFRLEAEAAAQLDHPAIVPIHEVGEHQGQHYFSMAFVEGQSLAKKLAEGPLPAREAAEIVRAVAEAVQYAHDRGVIHRDLKPGNILLDKQGQPRVTDFGLAKLIESGSDLTGTGQILGTPSYMPPEQAAAQVSAVGRLSDVYSLGAILYCLLTGRPPFQAASSVETLLQVQTQDPVPPRQLNPGIPRDLNTMALKCLEKVPARRYASARDVADELQRYLNGEPIVARPISTVERGWRWCKRRPLIPSVAAAVLVISTVSGLVFRHVAASERQLSLQREVVTAVDAVQNSLGRAVPFTIRDLKKLPSEMVLHELRLRYSEAEPDRKLELAYALAGYGNVDAEFLGTQIGQSAAEEVDNFVTAFGHDRAASLKALQALAARGESEQEWRLKARAAIVALHLGDDQLAADMCRIDDRPDPVQRTLFVDEFPAWHGNLTGLAAKYETLSDPALRSALCMGLGSIPADRLSRAESEAWTPLMSTWYQTAADAVTHSAAGWALRQWQVELPALSDSSQPDDGRDWFVNSLGMTMLRIRPGQFVRRETISNAKDQVVKLTRTFYLCDREVTIGQFREFLNDPTYPSEEKPAAWQDRLGTNNIVTSPRELVNWFDAVLFCNWLCRKEGLAPRYERSGRKHQRRVDNQDVEFDEWRLALNESGYRLPTEAEWEYACRAGTTSEYPSGNDAEIFGKYAVYQTGDLQCAPPGGSKLPNGWGLFDMHGSVSEWCHDWRGLHVAGELSDPTGPPEPLERAPHRALRGSNWQYNASFCQTANRSAFYPDQRSFGFRVACNSIR
jgi:serine/threonine protein kinase/formylglycine-generating enzyme required for sulfatase activity